LKSNICIICGKPIKGQKTIEHIFPKMAPEYCYDVLFCEKMTSFIRSRVNKGYTHSSCNKKKGCYIVSHKDIDNLYIPTYQKSILHKMRNVYNSVFEDIQNTPEYQSCERTLYGSKGE